MQIICLFYLRTMKFFYADFEKGKNYELKITGSICLAVRNLLGADEPEVPHLLQRGDDGEGEQLLQDVHLLDQRENPQNLRGPQHVRLSPHQVV